MFEHLMRRTTWRATLTTHTEKGKLGALTLYAGSNGDAPEENLLLLAVTAMAFLVFRSTALTLDLTPALQPQPGLNQKVDPLPVDLVAPTYDTEN